MERESGSALEAGPRLAGAMQEIRVLRIVQITTQVEYLSLGVDKCTSGILKADEQYF